MTNCHCWDLQNGVISDRKYWYTCCIYVSSKSCHLFDVVKAIISIILPTLINTMYRSPGLLTNIWCHKIKLCGLASIWSVGSLSSVNQLFFLVCHRSL